MARFTYDFPSGYDRQVAYDSETAPTVANYDLDMDAVDAGSLALASESEPFVSVAPEQDVVLDSFVDGDTPPTLAHDSDLLLRVEAKS